LLFLSVGCATDNKALLRDVENLAEKDSPEAQYHAGMFYNNGIGTPKDPAKALLWFERSALSGDPLGNYKLGCYYAGQGQGLVAVDSNKALEYKLVAAQHGYALAQYDVASAYYENGQMEEAVKWWRQSADQGMPEAFYALYAVHSEGSGVPRDVELAYGYLKIIERNASKQQMPEIKEKLNALENELSDTELSHAQEFARNWKPQRTPLTIKALSGIEETKRLVKSSSDK
jgi:TPR repeat protein